MDQVGGDSLLNIPSSPHFLFPFLPSPPLPTIPLIPSSFLFFLIRPLHISRAPPSTPPFPHSSPTSRMEHSTEYSHCCSLSRSMEVSTLSRALGTRPLASSLPPPVML